MHTVVKQGLFCIVFLAAGCSREAAKPPTPPAPSPAVTVFAPAPENRAPVSNGTQISNSRSSFGGIGYLAQCFTVPATAELTELDIFLNPNSGSNNSADFVIDIRPVDNGLPATADSSALLSFRLPSSANASSDFVNKRFTRIDLRPFHFVAHDDRPLAFVVRREIPDKQNFGLDTVGSATYAGRSYHRFRDNDAWRSQQNMALAFRLYGDDAAKDSAAGGDKPTIATTLKPEDKPAGKLMAESVPISDDEYQAQARAKNIAPKPPKPLQGRLLVGSASGNWVAEIHVFNGTDQARPLPVRPAISLTCSDASVALPARPSDRMGMPMPQPMAPNEGRITLITLSKADTPLAPGDYRLVAIYPDGILAGPLETTFTVPGASQQSK